MNIKNIDEFKIKMLGPKTPADIPSLPIVEPKPGQPELDRSDYNRQWSRFLGKVIVQPQVLLVTNFQGNMQQAEKIAQSLTDNLPFKLAYGFVSVPDNESVPGRSDSIQALGGKLGKDITWNGKKHYESGLGHKDLQMIEPYPNGFQLSSFGMLGHISAGISERWNELTPQEQKIYQLGAFVITHDEEVAALTGKTVDEVAGGSVHALTGYNPQYGVTEWKQITPGMVIEPDPSPMELDK